MLIQNHLDMTINDQTEDILRDDELAFERTLNGIRQYLESNNRNAKKTDKQIIKDILGFLHELLGFSALCKQTMSSLV